MCPIEANITSEHKVVLNVPTRCNSTYLMLEVAEKFERAFDRLEYDDLSYVIALTVDKGPGCPNYDDWTRARTIMKFLKVFYETTLAVSSSLEITSNSFFRKLVNIHGILNSFIAGNDIGLKSIAIKMKEKFDKYWDMESVNYMLLVALFLDPRFKLDYIEFSLTKMYAAVECDFVIEKLKHIIKELFAHYQAKYPIVPDGEATSVISSDSSSISHSSVLESSLSVDDEYRLRQKKKLGEHKKNELERYIEDDGEDDVHLDLLKWWRGKTQKYYVLSRMARDLLAIPVSTVSSESAFSTGGRILDSYRSSLSPKTVEALVCTQNWLKDTPRRIIAEVHNKPTDVVQVETDMFV